jgi:hypothetical protein
MSNYTKTTDFAAKDSLLSGNALKIINGTEINTEFNAIQTAINSKADYNNAFLTGTPTATTAPTGTNTTQLATTGYVIAAVAAEALSGNAALQGMYPVGSVYMNATNSSNPNILFGFGTWIAFGSGQVLLGQGTGYNAGSTGGTKDSVVPSHNHANSLTDAGHFHKTSGTINGSAGLSETRGEAFGGGNSLQTATNPDQGRSVIATNANITITNVAVGVDATDKNLQPYIVVYMWKRTA